MVNYAFQYDVRAIRELWWVRVTREGVYASARPLAHIWQPVLVVAHPHDDWWCARGARDDHEHEEFANTPDGALSAVASFWTKFGCTEIRRERIVPSAERPLLLHDKCHSLTFEHGGINYAVRGLFLRHAYGSRVDFVAMEVTPTPPPGPGVWSDEFTAAYRDVLRAHRWLA